MFCFVLFFTFHVEIISDFQKVAKLLLTPLITHTIVVKIHTYRTLLSLLYSGVSPIFFVPKPLCRMFLNLGSFHVCLSLDPGYVLGGQRYPRSNIVTCSVHHSRRHMSICLTRDHVNFENLIQMVLWEGVLKTLQLCVISLEKSIQLLK